MLKEKPLVSLIVPVYNVEKYLKECVQSLINQTYKNIEILLIDDGSTDRSGKICDEYSKVSRIRTYHKKNSGLGLTRNFGIQHAKGDYISFVDSDDFAEPEMIEKLVKAVSKSKAEVIIGSFTRVKQDGKVIFVKHYKSKIYIGEEIPNKLCPRILGGLPNKSDDIKASVWNNLYSLKFIKKYGLLFVSERKYISEDIDWTLKCLSYAKKVEICSFSDYCYRTNDESLSQKYNAKRFELSTFFYNYVSERIKELSLGPEAELRFKKQFLINVATCITQEKANNIRIAFSNIKNICSNPEVEKVLKSYPIYKLRTKPKIFSYLVKYKIVLILLLYVKLS